MRHTVKQPLIQTIGPVFRDRYMEERKYWGSALEYCSIPTNQGDAEHPFTLLPRRLLDMQQALPECLLSKALDDPRLAATLQEAVTALEPVRGDWRRFARGCNWLGSMRACGRLHEVENWLLAEGFDGIMGKTLRFGLFVRSYLIYSPGIVFPVNLEE